MKIKIDFGEPIIAESTVMDIVPTDLDDFYVTASVHDKTNLFFVLLTSAHFYEDKNDREKAAHLYYLMAYYLFLPLTPPGSCLLALHYINKALELNPLQEYQKWLGLIQKGN